MKKATVHFLDENPYFAHFSSYEKEDFLALSKNRAFKKGDEYVLEKELCYPVNVCGFINGTVIPQGHFFGVMPFTQFGDKTRIQFSAPSSILLWNTEDLNDFFFRYPTTIPPFLLALHDNGHILTPYAVKVGKANTRIFSFYSQRSVDLYSSMEEYAGELFNENENRRILLLDVVDKRDPQRPADLFTKSPDGIFKLTNYLRRLSFIGRYVFKAELNVDGLKAEHIGLWAYILNSVYFKFNYVLVHLGRKPEHPLSLEVLKQSHRIFTRNEDRKTELEMHRRFLKERLISHAVHVHPLPDKTESWQPLLPEAQAQSYALSMGPCIRAMFSFMGGLEALRHWQKPGVIMAAGWSALIAALYAREERMTDVYRFFEEQMSNFKPKKIFEIVFPKNGIIDYVRFRKFIRDVFGLVRMEDLPVRLVFRAVEPGSGQMVFLDQGQLVDNLIHALRFPGLLSMPVADDYIGYSGDYYYSEEKALAYFRRMHYRYSLHFAAEESYTDSGESGDRFQFFDLLLQPYFRAKTHRLSNYPSVGKFNRQILLPAATGWDDFFDWKKWAVRGQRTVHGFLAAQDDFASANLKLAQQKDMKISV